MRKSIAVAVASGMLVLVGGIFAAGIEKEKTADQVMREIRKSQNVSDNGKIDCNKVTEKQFEELGDAVMGKMHPDNSQHAFMDGIMGGEGSAGLAYMHRMMGARYLGCWGGFGNMMGGGMMAGGMMGNYQGDPKEAGGYGGMMGNGNFNNWHGRKGANMMNMGGWWQGGAVLMWILFLVLLVIIIIALVKYIGGHGLSGGSAIDVLKKRYAAGEITKKEFEEKKKDLI